MYPLEGTHVEVDYAASPSFVMSVHVACSVALRASSRTTMGLTASSVGALQMMIGDHMFDICLIAYNTQLPPAQALMRNPIDDA